MLILNYGANFLLTEDENFIVNIVIKAEQKRGNDEHYK